MKNRKAKYRKAIVFCAAQALVLLLAAAGPAAAQEELIPADPALPPSEAPPATGEEKKPERTGVDLTGVIDAVHGTLSKTVLTTAGWLDSFFGDERYDDELNRSYVRFHYDFFRQQGSPWDKKPDVTVRLVLPQLRRKTLLVIAGDPREDLETSSPRAGAANEQFSRTEDRHVTTSLHYFFRSTVQESLSIRSGFKLHKGAPVVFLGPRYRFLVPVNAWNLRFVQDATWASDKGWLSRTEVDFERRLPYDLFFRTTAEGVWTEDVTGYLYSVAFVLRQPLTPVRALQYEWISSFHTRPVNELVDVTFRVRYRQRVWRDWLFGEVAPQVSFPRTRDFESTPGILFRLEALFGKF